MGWDIEWLTFALAFVVIMMGTCIYLLHVRIRDIEHSKADKLALALWQSGVVTRDSLEPGSLAIPSKVKGDLPSPEPAKPNPLTTREPLKGQELEDMRRRLQGSY
jgi:hypothetical protein